MRRVAVMIVATLMLPAIASGQDTLPTNPQFDVASVKESRSLETDGVFRAGPGRFAVANLSLRSMIQYAYRLRDYQIIAAPRWAETRYQVEATFDNVAATNEEVRGMLRRLLADRFALRVRREQRNIEMYALTKARQDGTLGPKLRPSDANCDTPATEATAQPPAGAGRPRPTCTMFQTAWFIRGSGQTMPALVQLLDQAVGSPVIDRTGLSGRFDVDVQWGTRGDAAVDPGNQTQESLASLFTALREQLGLKLEPMRGPYDVLVIDAVSRPTPD